MDLSPGTIGIIIASVLGAFGMGKGIDIYISRKRAVSTEPNGNGSLGVTGPIPTLVTSEECKNSRGEITGRFAKATGELKVVLQEQTKQLNKLNVTVVALDGKIDTALEKMKNETAGQIKDHEMRQHRGKKVS
jgi:hypothetical protein